MTAIQEIQENINSLFDQIETKRNELDGLMERYRELCDRQFQIINASYGIISDDDFDSLAGF